jgi:hypothetical protein
MKIFPLQLPGGRALFWTMLFLAVNLLFAFAGCGSSPGPDQSNVKPTEMPSGQPNQPPPGQGNGSTTGRGASPSGKPSGAPTGGG